MASSYRLKRGPVIGLLIVVGVVGALLITRSSVRPQVDVYQSVQVPAAYVGTPYAFDALVCLRASSVGTTAEVVAASDRGGVHTRLGLRPPGTPPAVAFPVRAQDLAPLTGLHVAAQDQVCGRVLVTADQRGDAAAGPVRVRFRYGPFGLLRTTTSVTPPVVLQVTGTGTDPRTAAVGG